MLPIKKMPKKFIFTKKEEELFDDFIRNHCTRIQQAAYLTHYEMSRFYSSEDLKHNGRETAMQIDVDHQYLAFDLGYGVEWAKHVWGKKDYDSIISTLCHEVTHIPTTEVEEKLHSKAIKKDKEFYYEKLTEHTSRWLYESYLRYIEIQGIDIKTGLIKKKKHARK